MKRHWKILTITAVVAIAGLALVAVAFGALERDDPSTPVDAAGTPSEGASAASVGARADTDCVGCSTTAATALTEAESAGLVYMREEEKLARDVYQELGSLYSVRAFTNIASSEMRHMAAVEGLLDAYGVDDPADPDVAGVYQNPDLQELYTELVDQGDDDLVAALKVGIAIEELDIADLERYIAETENADLRRAYANLLRGSENHLRAFESLLARNGG